MVRTAILALMLVAPGLAWATNASDDRLLRDAADRERKGDWRGAAEIYWKALGQNRQSVELRQKYLHSLRRVRLADRHADPVYRKRIQELTLSRALTAYLDAIGKIQVNYVERVPLSVLFQQGMEELTFALADPGFAQGFTAGIDDEDVFAFISFVRQTWPTRDFQQPAELQQVVKQIALEGQRALGVRPSFIVMEFVCGACNALDERSAYIPPSEEYTTHLGQLNSLGMLIAAADSGLYVERVVPGSWAAQAGVKDGDRIVLKNVHRDDRGEIGSLVEIGIRSSDKEGERSLRLPESLPSVFEEDVLPGGIGYLRLASFQKETMHELEQALVRMQMRGMRALVLDLRGNPGGLFPVSVQVAERFLPEGVIVTTQGQGSSFNRTFQSHSGMAAIDIPLVVLIDGDTASAAEVLAGALKDNERALLIGTPTFGKGTIQTVLQLTDGGGMRITLARFYTPRGVPYNGIGVSPHLLEPLRAREVALEQARTLLTIRP